MSFWTTDDLKKVERAIASGALTVDYAGQGRVTYRSIEDLRRAREMILAALAEAGAIATRPTRRYASFSNGLTSCSRD